MTPDPGKSTSEASEAPAKIETSAKEGQQSQRGQRQGSRRRHGNQRNGNWNGSTPKAPKFEGQCTDLQGHIYDVSSPRQAADMYTKTTREIVEYIDTNYTLGSDISGAIETLQEPVIPKPKPVNGGDDTDKAIWAEEIKDYVKQKRTIQSGMKKAFGLVWGQCSEAMRTKLQSKDDHEKIRLAQEYQGRHVPVPGSKERGTLPP